MIDFKAIERKALAAKRGTAEFKRPVRKQYNPYHHAEVGTATSSAAYSDNYARMMRNLGK